ncbi:unnamed protein product [Mytilus coruscus]|uniref:Myb-like domain-containing protein n=1 Tax=Mytilus coruscus TaxID=42192 RepID=A0A6J8D6C0_MYTCO|nr:unnamed protein product [Mytilus coruscus]
MADNASSAAKKPRERKPNFSEAEISVLQDEVEKNYAIINDKFSTAVSNKKKSAIWNKISMMVSALGVAHRSAKECRDKWSNTKKEAKKVFSVTKKDHARTGGGPQAKPLSLAIHRTIDLCKDSASFKGFGGVESCIKGDKENALIQKAKDMHLEIKEFLINYLPSKSLPKIGDNVSISYEDKTRDITEDDRDELTRYLCTFKEINLTIPDIPSILHDTIAFILQNSKKTAVNIQVPCPAATVVELGTLTTKKIENPKKRKATADDVYELQILYLKGEMAKQTKEMKKLDLQIELLEEMKRDKENTPLIFSQLLMN